ncbi:chromo domain-containing protein cec-1-like [Phoenix dactylifera]|uniref:Chromo domain-containing protein cec-1-like n=1 Tax=Phoenix dactylifera TaxID=42345 RepID=A0A8B7CL71_PHODC|nr:chromo domain-containing protein cec-1-like [Phoenix dactylifera]
MATSRPRDARLKERSSSASSAPHHTDTLHGRRTTRPLVPGSSDRDPVRRPMASSSTTATSRGRTQTPSGAVIGRRVPVKTPIEKPPSPSVTPRRVPTPNTLKERTDKSSSSLPRAAISSKPASDKASKPLKSTKTQPSVRAKSLGAPTKEVTGTTTPNATEQPPATKSEQEEETLIQVEESEPVDVPAIKDDVPYELDLTGSFTPNIPEDSTDSTSQTDRQKPSSPTRESEIATNDEGVGGDGNRVDGDEESPKEPEEKPVMESSEEPQSEPAVGSGKPEESEKEKATRVESSETTRPEVVPFRRPEAAATGRKFLKDAPRSNDVIEEARTKLMEKRKSKVLALVGAFETVISLQEPEGQTGQSQGKSGEEGADEGSNATKESTESM